MRERNKNVPRGLRLSSEIPFRERERRGGLPSRARARSQENALREVEFHRDYHARRGFIILQHARYFCPRVHSALPSLAGVNPRRHLTFIACVSPGEDEGGIYLAYVSRRVKSRDDNARETGATRKQILKLKTRPQMGLIDNARN